MRRTTVSICLLALSMMVTASRCAADHRVAIQGKGKLAILDTEGNIEWQMPWQGIHDIHVLPSGNIMVQRGGAEVVEIDPQTKQVVWQYDSSTANGNTGKPIEVHSFQPLPDGNVMIAETTTKRIIEVNREGEIVKSTPLKINHPHPHTDTRLVRKLSDADYLVCHEGDGCIRQYDGKTGDVVWQYEVPLFGRDAADGHGPSSFGNKAFSAIRLASGNTLITTGNGHSVIEVTPDKEIVWKLDQNELPGITLGWVTTAEVLPSGNYVIGNCHAGEGQPILIEIEPKTKEVVWTLDRYEDFGNDVSNTQILPADPMTRR